MGNKQPINRLAQKASVNGDQKNTCLLTSNGQRKDFTCLVHLKHNSQYLIYSKVFLFSSKIEIQHIGNFPKSAIDLSRHTIKTFYLHHNICSPSSKEEIERK